MNIVKVLKKQVESGKTIMLNDGNVISKEEIRKATMKNYLAGVKTGEIPTTKSFDDYFAETGDSYVEVQEVIDFIEGVDGENN